MRRLPLLAPLLAVVAAPAAAAPTSWTAVQKSKTPGSPLEQEAEVRYGHHHLRIDMPGQRLVVDFASGALLYIDVSEEQYARVTLEEMVALREKQLTAAEAELEKMPPEIQEQMRGQIEQAKAQSAKKIDARATGTRDEIGGLACEMYTWSSGDGEGEACIAGDPPFDASAFREDSARLAEKMHELGAGSAAASMAILQLGEHGLPVLIRQTMTLGARSLEVVSTFEDVEAKTLPKSAFLPPKGFRERDFETMMREAVSAPPSMPSMPD
jgi:hypothetical protein